MITLRLSKAEELAAFHDIERQPHAQPFLINYTLERHQQGFVTAEIIYLTIVHESFDLVGYIILEVEGDGKSIEFRRIAIDQNCLGIGQLTIQALESFCQETLQAERIWLDVFDDNHKGMHIYEKLGYLRFGEQDEGGRNMYLYEKWL